MDDQLTAVDALHLVMDQAQWMRENGESDMRSIIYCCSSLIRDITAGKPTDQILSEWVREEEE